MVQWHFLKIDAICYFIQLLETCHIEMAKPFMPKHDAFIQGLATFAFFLLNVHIEYLQVLFLSCFRHMGTLFTLQLSLSNSIFNPSEMNLLMKMKVF
jgi:hypothetical protein